MTSHKLGHPLFSSAGRLPPRRTSPQGLSHAFRVTTCTDTSWPQAPPTPSTSLPPNQATHAFPRFARARTRTKEIYRDLRNRWAHGDQVATIAPKPPLTCCFATLCVTSYVRMLNP